MFDGFTIVQADPGGVRLSARQAGSGPAVLLLHGFPETHLMWRDIAPLMARSFTVVCADLKGYGDSGCPSGASSHEAYSKRAMAADMAGLMTALGHDRFCVAGHDRGARVAQRLALDAPERVRGLAVLDVIPVSEAWDRADDRFAVAFWPWSLLAQPAPLPEQVLTRCADAVVASAASEWGSSSAFPPEVAAIYADQLRDPARAHAICEEYRAAATVDRAHEAADRAAGRRIRCPTLALWSATGPLASWYAAEGGPLAIWRDWCDDLSGRPVDGGHFFPEEHPGATAAALTAFFDHVVGASGSR